MTDRNPDASQISEETSNRTVYGVPTLVDDVIVLTVFDGDKLHDAPYPIETFRLGVDEGNTLLTLGELRNIAADVKPAACGEFFLGVKADGTADVITMPWIGETNAIEEKLAEMNALREVRGIAMRISDEVLVARAEVEYRALAGEIVLVDRAYCYENEADGEWVDFDRPIAMRVAAFSDYELKTNILRWTEEGQIDPVYCVSPLEDHPDLHGKRVTWTEGTSYSSRGVVDKASFVIAPQEVRTRYANAQVVDTENVPPPTRNTSSPWYRPG